MHLQHPIWRPLLKSGSIWKWHIDVYLEIRVYVEPRYLLKATEKPTAGYFTFILRMSCVHVVYYEHGVSVHNAAVSKGGAAA